MTHVLDLQVLEPSVDEGIDLNSTESWALCPGEQPSNLTYVLCQR